MRKIDLNPELREQVDSVIRDVVNNDYSRLSFTVPLVVGQVLKFPTGIKELFKEMRTNEYSYWAAMTVDGVAISINNLTRIGNGISYETRVLVDRIEEFAKKCQVEDFYLVLTDDKVRINNWGRHQHYYKFKEVYGNPECKL